MATPLVIALTGRKGSGKTTAADFLVECGFVRVKFAGALKDMMRALYIQAGFNPVVIAEKIEGSLKEEPCSLLQGNSPRYAMQTLGTEWGRDMLGDQLWTRIAANRIQGVTLRRGAVVVDDLRYPNELEVLEGMGAAIIHIYRPSNAVGDNHTSEVPLHMEDHHHLVNNMGSVNNLREATGALAGSLAARNGASA